MAQRLNVTMNKKPCYDIVFSNDWQDLAEELKEMQLSERKLCIVTDSNVDAIYGKTVLDLITPICQKAVKYAFAAGEENKNLDTVKDVYRFLIQEGFDRKDKLIALGGGVVGDLTGFVAATYLRGIDFIQVPTTLLAQADSSVGGKTAVDFDGFKNMVGAFYMPRLVYMNISTLNSLDARQYASGFAEVMKHGLIKDENFYTWLIDNLYEINDKDPDVVLEMVMRSCNIKRAVVEKDPTEQADRMLLNFGHTLGHAIEKHKNFEMFHGECVALGAIAAAFISWKRGLLSMEEYYEIRDMFVPFNLPISVEDIDKEAVLDLTRSDKKADSDKIKFVLLKKIGKAFVDDTVTREEMDKALDEIIYVESND